MADDRRRTSALGKDVLIGVMFAIPVVVILVMGWTRRWTADDAFVNLRIVKEIRHGYGPVVNPGDRVEAGTSPLWILLLTILDLLTPIRLEWIAAVVALAFTTAAMWLVMHATQRLQQHLHGSTYVTIPVGALVYCIIPPAWDYATSGLENGLGLLWFAGCWFAISASLRSSTERPVFPVAALLLFGGGPLVRPDFAVFTVAFGAAALLVSAADRRSARRIVVWVLAIPIVSEMLRIAYYGMAVPNTAVAKEAGKSHSPQGWRYLRDLIGPYSLLIPLALIVIAACIPIERRTWKPGRTGRAILAIELGALAHLVYIVRLGGDFMHGRMLLPSLFVALAPVSVLSVTHWRAVAVAALVPWMFVCGFSLRPSYSKIRSTAPIDAIDKKSHISDERLVHMRLARNRNPVTLDDYDASIWGFGGRKMVGYLESGTDGLILDSESAGRIERIIAPMDERIPTRAVINIGALGMYSYALPADTTVIDRFGLASPLAAHQYNTTRGRPGHEKDLPIAWVVAEYAGPQAIIPPWVSATDVALARKALTCGGFPDRQRARFEPFGFKQVLRNFTNVWSRWHFRFHKDPAVAVAQLCKGS